MICDKGQQCILLTNKPVPIYDSSVFVLAKTQQKETVAVIALFCYYSKEVLLYISPLYNIHTSNISPTASFATVHQTFVGELACLLVVVLNHLH